MGYPYLSAERQGDTGAGADSLLSLWAAHLRDGSVRNRAKKKRLSAWAENYFDSSLNSLLQLRDVIEISATGITFLQRLPRVLEALHDSSDDSDGDKKSQLEDARRRARLAKSEEESDFSTLHGFGVVALWSWLESFIIDLVVLWVCHRPAALKDTTTAKIKVSPAEFVRVNGIDKARLVVEAMDREMSGPQRTGFNRFDQLLSAIGFELQLEAPHRQDLYELQKVRNCLAHRNGIVDAKLQSECGWLDIASGDPLRITAPMFRRYARASHYLLLMCIIAAKKGTRVDHSDIGVPYLAQT